MINGVEFSIGVSKFAAHCNYCGKPINEGDPIQCNTDHGITYHNRCYVGIIIAQDGNPSGYELPPPPPPTPVYGDPTPTPAPVRCLQCGFLDSDHKPAEPGTTNQTPRCPVPCDDYRLTLPTKPYMVHEMVFGDTTLECTIELQQDIVELAIGKIFDEILKERTSAIGCGTGPLIATITITRIVVNDNGRIVDSRPRTGA